MKKYKINIVMTIQIYNNTLALNLFKKNIFTRILSINY